MFVFFILAGMSDDKDMWVVLERYFGFRSLRDGQQQVIESLLAVRPALAVFPTGGGKSLCYQLPALMLDGLTLVISPLIALMKDQVDGLMARGVAAARLDSTLSVDELASVYDQLDAGRLKLLYIAPERLANEGFRLRVKRLKVSMVAIDEAHCISEWGHNFRPDYLKLAGFCKQLRVKRVLALTATATPKVAREIRRAFGVAVVDHVSLSFHRKNLDLRVTVCEVGERKELLLEKVRGIKGSVVVYVTRQETAEEVATYLVRAGESARAYHAGLLDEFRFSGQQAFMSGDVRVIVATIAFGMGIDKSDIRGVIHYNMPKSLENYTQEIGRGGRDGELAVCEWLACADDLTVLENFVYADTPSEGALVYLLDRLLRLGERFDVSLYDLSYVCDMRSSVVATVLAYLEGDGILEVRGRFYGTYQLKFVRSRDQVLSGYETVQRRFLEKVLSYAKEGRSWLSFDVGMVADELGVKRERVVEALTAFERAGDAALRVSGVRVAYGVKKEPGDLRELAMRYVGLFERRELADLERLSQVLEMASFRGCLTGYVTRHFGEKLEGGCGHCDRCRGGGVRRLEKRRVPVILDEDWLRIRELANAGHAALATPRQMARFLCGMTSPASTRARLSRHDLFGIWSEQSFKDVLQMAEAL